MTAVPDVWTYGGAWFGGFALGFAAATWLLMIRRHSPGKRLLEAISEANARGHAQLEVVVAKSHELRRVVKLTIRATELLTRGSRDAMGAQVHAAELAEVRAQLLDWSRLDDADADKRKDPA